MSGYILREAQSRDEIDAIVDIMWVVRFHPYMPSTGLSLPTFGFTKDDHDRSLAEAKERAWMEHQRASVDANTTDPDGSRKSSKRWIYAVEEKSGKAVGCARFDYYTGSIFPNGLPQMNLAFWPDGEAKRCGEFILQQCYAPRSMWMQRPHGGFGTMAVLPQFRNRGIATMLVNWAVAQLDELGVEGFVESTDIARPLYEKGGFITVMKIGFFIPSDAPEEWAKWEHEFKPDPWNAMWRPVHGKLVEGERSRPWQLGPTIPV